MKATRFEYRFRYALHTILYVLGFFAPWNYALHLDHGKTIWEYLAIVFFQHGWLRFEAASVTLLLLAILFGGLGAWLRTWGAAYLGEAVVQSGDLHGAGVVADGPYRHVRNPLYLGTFLHTLALALIMPPSGAIFTIVTIGLLQLRLISAEEPFLTAKLGQPYLEYCTHVPRLVPAAPARIPASGVPARWPQAMLGEIYMIAVPVGFAIFGWSYNSNLLLRCVIVAFGLSLLSMALRPGTTSPSEVAGIR